MQAKDCSSRLRPPLRQDENHNIQSETVGDTRDLEALLERIYEIEGVRSTRSFVALNTYLERGPRPEKL